MVSGFSGHIASGNSLVPDGLVPDNIELLPKPVFTYHPLGIVGNLIIAWLQSYNKITAEAQDINL